MGAPVSALEAGRIRDAARLSWAGGFAGIAAFVLSFFIEGAGIGFILWPIAFGILVVALFPILRPSGLSPALIVTLVGLTAAVLEVVGIIVPRVNGQLRISPIFGAGTICLGAWFVGAAAASKVAQTLPTAITRRLMRGGMGFVLVGASWFVEDPFASLGALGVGAVVSGGVGPLFKHLRRYGLPPEPAPAPEAESSGDPPMFSPT